MGETGERNRTRSPARVGAEDLADPLFFLDAEGRIVYWNSACEEAFDHPQRRVLGVPLLEVFGSELDEGLELLLRQGPERVKPTLLPGVSLGEGTWDVRVAPSRSGSATAVHCLPFLGSLPGWPRLLADSVDAIWGLDEEDTIIAWNRGAEEMFGYTASEIIGESLERLIPVDLLEAREPERLRTALQELGAVRDYETRRVKKDGEELRVSLTRTVLRHGSGRILGSSTIVRDLSQRERLERQIIESEKLATVGQLAATVAQEIGAPLTAIGLAVENVRRSACETCDNRARLETVSQQLHRIGRLARHLVELAKPGALELSRVRVDRVIEQATELLDPSFQRSNIRIEVKAEPDLPEIWADAGQLQQALLNLLMNGERALKSRGGGRIEVTARPRRGPPLEGRPVRRVVEIRVSDDGPGIDPADLPFVFTPFFSRSGGTGLGLPLAQQIVHAHGGTIEADSSPGQGATFTLQIPVDSDD